MKRANALALLDERFRQRLDEEMVEFPQVRILGDHLREMWVEILYPSGTVVPVESEKE